MIIDVYTDGGCSGNPGPGAWAYVAVLDGEKRSESGFEMNTTNNKMELTAVIRALEQVEGLTQVEDSTFRIYTDSQYVQKGITEWIERWIINGWITRSKTPVKNRELWQSLNDVASRLRVEWNWVRGHVGNELNEACDALVQSEIRRHR